MRRPSSVFSLLVWIFAILGAAFLLSGAAAMAQLIPMRGGAPWMFLPVGGGFLLAWGVCALIVGQNRRTAARLRAQGVPVTGQVQAVKHHVFTSFGGEFPLVRAVCLHLGGAGVHGAQRLSLEPAPRGPAPNGLC